METNKSVAELAKDLGVGVSTLQSWRRKAGVSRHERARPSQDLDLSLEEAKRQLRAVRKENEILRQERDILKKAATFFANETKR